MNTVNMARLSRCAIFLTLPLDREALAGATGLEPAPSCVTGRGAVVIVIDSDRCGVFGTYWGGMVLVAGFAEVICKDEVWLWRLDLNRRTPLPARLVQMLQSPDEVHVAIKIGNEKSASVYR